MEVDACWSWLELFEVLECLKWVRVAVVVGGGWR
jgi:hypothetical protein